MSQLNLVALVVKEYDPAIDFFVQERIVGNQFAGRVGFFLHVDDFSATYERMIAAGITFVRPPRTEAYGQVAVFLDIAGNKWDLLGPTPTA
jgi:predicted enzyme related to lactoylglutathione lyase